MPREFRSADGLTEEYVARRAPTSIGRARRVLAAASTRAVVYYNSGRQLSRQTDRRTDRSGAFESVGESIHVRYRPARLLINLIGHSTAATLLSALKQRLADRRARSSDQHIVAVRRGIGNDDGINPCSICFTVESVGREEVASPAAHWLIFIASPSASRGHLVLCQAARRFFLRCYIFTLHGGWSTDTETASSSSSSSSSYGELPPVRSSTRSASNCCHAWSTARNASKPCGGGRHTASLAVGFEHSPGEYRCRRQRCTERIHDSVCGAVYGIAERDWTQFVSQRAEACVIGSVDRLYPVFRCCAICLTLASRRSSITGRRQYRRGWLQRQRRRRALYGRSEIEQANAVLLRRPNKRLANAVDPQAKKFRIRKKSETKWRFVER